MAEIQYTVTSLLEVGVTGSQVVSHNVVHYYQPHSVFCWQYSSFSDFSSSIRVLFWFSNTATRFSRHFMYSFFFLRHSLAASLLAQIVTHNKWGNFPQNYEQKLKPLTIVPTCITLLYLSLWSQTNWRHTQHVTTRSASFLAKSFYHILQLHNYTLDPKTMLLKDN